MALDLNSPSSPANPSGPGSTTPNITNGGFLDILANNPSEIHIVGFPNGSPDVFGNPSLSTNGVSLNTAPTQNFKPQSNDAATINADSQAFGLLTNFFGPMVRNAQNPGSTGLSGGNVVVGNISNTGTASGIQNISYGVGVNFALPEQQNTFGTPQYFRALGQQQIAPLTGLAASLEQYNVAALTRNPGYVSQQDAVNVYNASHSVPVENNFSAGHYQAAYVAPSYADVYNKAQAAAYYNTAPQTYSFSAPSLPRGYMQDNTLYGMNPGERFLGNGSGAFVGPTHYIGTTTYSGQTFGYPTTTNMSYR